MAAPRSSGTHPHTGFTNDSNCVECAVKKKRGGRRTMTTEQRIETLADVLERLLAGGIAARLSMGQVNFLRARVRNVHAGEIVELPSPGDPYD